MKKVEKKPVAEEPKQERVQLKKPRVTEKPKEEQPAGVQLKPTPARERKEEEKKEPVKLKPVPQQKKDNEDEKKASDDFRGVGLPMVEEEKPSPQKSKVSFIYTRNHHLYSISALSLYSVPYINKVPFYHCF